MISKDSDKSVHFNLYSFPECEKGLKGEFERVVRQDTPMLGRAFTYSDVYDSKSSSVDSYSPNLPRSTLLMILMLLQRKQKRRIP